jgi:hypothetical protein
MCKNFHLFVFLLFIFFFFPFYFGFFLLNVAGPLFENLKSVSETSGYFVGLPTMYPLQQRFGGAQRSCGSGLETGEDFASRHLRWDGRSLEFARKLWQTTQRIEASR